MLVYMGMLSMGWYSSIRWKRDNYYRMILHYISHKFNLFYVVCRSVTYVGPVYFT